MMTRNAVPHSNHPISISQTYQHRMIHKFIAEGTKGQKSIP
jgi:hypothetical protein